MSDIWPEELTAWTWRRPVTYTPGRTLTGFPNCLKLDSTKISYSDFKADGSDLRLALPDGAILNREIDAWNPDGQSVIHVKDSLTSGTPRRWYLYGGNPDAADMPLSDRQATWDGHFGAVFHMQQSDFPMADATSNANAIQPGTWPPETGAPGLLGKGLYYSSTLPTAYAPHSDSINPTLAITIEVWFRTDCDHGYLCRKYLASPPYAGYGFTIYGSGILGAWVGSGWLLDSAHTVNDGNWHHAVMRFNGARLSIWVDGQENIYADRANGLGSSVNADVGGGGTSNFWCEELRISSVERSADWVQETYAQLSGDVWEVGQKEWRPAAGAVPVILANRDA